MQGVLVGHNRGWRRLIPDERPQRPVVGLTVSIMELQARDRYLDLLRGASIVAVVVGHWLVADLSYADGQLALRSSLAEVPPMWPLTWVFQVIPVFFFVAGAVNGPSWQRCQSRGDGYAAFVIRRIHRVLIPTLVAVTVIALVSALLQATGGGGVAGGGAMLLQPLWFLAVYLALMALTPWTWAAFQRWGTWLFVGLLVVIVAADFGRIGLEREMSGYVNVVAIWLFVYGLGFAFAQGWLTRQRAVGLAAVGAVSLVLLVTVGPYPTRMVGIPGDRLSNMHPPTLAVLALALAQIGVLVWLRPYVSPWLERPKVWFCVVWLNLSIMTLYLWHEFAMVSATRLLLSMGWPQPDPGTGSWWLMRLVWVVVAGAALLGLVLVFGRFERLAPPTAPAPSTKANVTAITMVVLLFAGLLGLAGTRVTEIAEIQHPMGVPLSPVMALGLIWAAAGLLRASRRLSPEAVRA